MIQPNQDPVTDLAHRLIEREANDASRPFMVSGHPFLKQRHDRLVRSCFYYTVMITPRVTALYDNWDKGGMCDLTPHELRAIWKTPRLLLELGVTFEDLQAGTALPGDSSVSPPDWDLDALNNWICPIENE